MKWILFSGIFLLIAAVESRWLLDEICDYELEDPNGLVVSPNYPHSYPSSISCTYRLKAEPGSIITLSLSDIDLGWNSSDTCNGYLEIYDGHDEASPRIERLCGTDYYIPGRVINSSANELFVKFENHESSRGNRGFHAIYKSVYQKCGGFYTQNNTSIAHPKNGTYYDNLDNCTWIIQAPAAHIVNLTLSRFLTESTHDYLQIREVYQGQTVDIIRLTGSVSTPRSIVSRDRTMILNFRSDSSVVNTGFNSTYRFINNSKMGN